MQFDPTQTLDGPRNVFVSRVKNLPSKEAIEIVLRRVWFLTFPTCFLYHLANLLLLESLPGDWQEKAHQQTSCSLLRLRGKKKSDRPAVFKFLTAAGKARGSTAVKAYLCVFAYTGWPTGRSRSEKPVDFFRRKRRTIDTTLHYTTLRYL